MRARFVIVRCCSRLNGDARIRTALTWGEVGDGICHAVHGECQPHLSHGKQSATQDGCLLPPRRHDAAADAGLHAWWILGSGNQGNSHYALMPWLEMGWNVVNVEYRLGVATDPYTLAPAAVDDCFCALRFIAALPANYNIDRNSIVVTGESAGGHSRLAMGIIPESAGLGRECAGAAAPPAAGGGGRAGGHQPRLPPLPPCSPCRSQDRRGHQLVRHHRRAGCHRRTQSPAGRRPLVWRHAQRARSREESVAL